MNYYVVNGIIKSMDFIKMENDVSIKLELESYAYDVNEFLLEYNLVEGIFETLDISSLKDASNKPIRFITVEESGDADGEEEAWLVGIGHFYKDKWLDLTLLSEGKSESFEDLGLGEDVSVLV